MSRRILGQCTTSDFKYLEHLITVIAQGGEIDTSNLTNRQKVAIRVLQYFQENDISFSVLLKIREVLVWDMDDGTFSFQFKLINPRDMQTRIILSSMRARRR